MKKIVAAIAMAAILALGLFAVGCSGQAESPKNDTKDMAVTDAGATGEADAFYVLLTGNDTRTGTSEITKAQYADGNARTDTIMLVRVAPSTHKVTIMTIPRDTGFEQDGQLVKINNSYLYDGIEGTVKAVEELTGVEIKYYLNTTFVNFEKLIDELGGVKVEVPVDMSLADIVSGNNVTLQQGVQELDGAEALVLARFRKGYQGMQDATRQAQDRNIVAALIEQVAAVPGTVDSAVTALLDNCESNWPKEDLTEVVTDFAQNASKIIIYSATGPYDGDNDPQSGEWIATRDEKVWARIIETADMGMDPAGIVELPPAPQLAD